MMHTLLTRLVKYTATPVFILFALLSVPLTVEAAGEQSPVAFDSQSRFVINLESSTSAPKLTTWPSELAKYQSYRLYVTSRGKDGKTWYRLRMGFFSDYKDANQALTALKKHFPSAWLGRANQKEIDSSAASTIAPTLRSAGSSKATPLPTTVRKSRAAVADDPEASFAINLESDLKAFDLSKIASNEDMQRHQVYVTTFEIRGRTWYRLRLGFFPTQAEAVRMQKKLKALYPKAWVTKTPLPERLAASESAPPVKARPTDKQDKAASAEQALARAETTRPKQLNLPPLTDEQLTGLMTEAQTEMTANNLTRVIQLYTKVARYTDHAQAKEAQELLGLAREKNGQLAHAAFEYKRYLEQYPDGEDAARVKQRLAGVLTARADPRERLRATKDSQSKQKYPWRVNGGWSQFYRRDENKLSETADTVTSRSALDTDLNLSARRRSPNFDVRARLTTGYSYDFLQTPENDNSSGRLSSLNVDITHLASGLSTRLGRQSRNTGGVFGRFDGGLVSYQATKWGKVNVVAGYPVDSSRDGFQDERSLYGASMELGTFANAWEMELYYLKQLNSSYTEREAVGGELRYFSPSSSLVSLLDYDIFYNELNLASLLGNWRLRDTITLNASYNYRKSPLLNTRNSLIGQTFPYLKDLIGVVGEDVAHQLALDRTADSHSLTLGGSKALSPKTQFTTSLSASQILGTPATTAIPGLNDVEATPDGELNYFYNAQLIGNGLIKAGDLGSISVQYSDTGTAATYALALNTRYPLTQNWRVNPKFRTSYRANSDNDDTQYAFGPALRIDYKPLRHLRFETELGGNWATTTTTLVGTQDTQTQQTTSYYMFLGYRYDW